MGLTVGANGIQKIEEENADNISSRGLSYFRAIREARSALRQENT